VIGLFVERELSIVSLDEPSDIRDDFIEASHSIGPFGETWAS